jgi:DNA-binding transcriptional regulator YdaS (Cro superfamily)
MSIEKHTSLKKYLSENQILYREFAEKLGVHTQSIKNIVSGTQRPGLLLALKIEKLTSGQVTAAQLAEDFEKIARANKKKK